MNKGKFSFSIGKPRDKESDGLRNIFDSGKDGKNTEECGLVSSGNFQSISATSEYNNSLKFYSQHPELLEYFEKKPDELERQEARELKREERAGKTGLGKSKYLDKIKEYVELRNIEIQEIQEEKIQKEVQKEDVQVFITDAYKDVLEERRKLKNSLTRRKLPKGENNSKAGGSRSSGPLSIFEMRFSPELDETQNEESEAQTVPEEVKEDLSTVSMNPANSSISEGSNAETEAKNFKTSQDLKRIKIEQARERYLLRKQMREQKSKE